METIGFREFARLVDCAPSTPIKASKGGWLTPAVVMVGGERQLNKEKALALWAIQNEQQVEAEDDDGPVAAGENALFDARVSKEEWTAKLRQLDYETRRQLLLDRAVVRRACFEHSRRTRDAVTNIPARVGATTAAALLLHIRSEMARGLSIDEALEPRGVEAVVITTMSEECRAIVEGVADLPPQLDD